MTQSHRRDRKKKRLMYGAAAAVVATATLGTIAVASPGLLGATGDAKAAAGDVSLQSQFANAAREFDVPQSVLMAVSYRQTRWESHDGLPSTTGAYNVMGLTDVDAEDIEQPSDEERLAHLNASGKAEIEKTFNKAKALAALPKETVDTDDPRLHTLDKAAELIDSSADAVKDDTAASIRAGAALLAEYQKQAGAELSEDPADWYPAVARYSQSSNKKSADLFAKRVFESIKTGERALTTDGESVALPADPAVEPVEPSNVPLAATFASTTALPTPECPPTGLVCDFRPAEVPSTGQRNYTLANRANGTQLNISRIVIHDTEGSYDGTIATFQSADAKGSAHYLIRANDGLVTQMVENKNIAWHAGNWSDNMHDIGVEHEGFAIRDGYWYTEPQYESSAKLVKFLAAQYGIPLDREHVIGHDEIAGHVNAKVSGMHWDAGPFWDWNHYMSLLGAPTGAGGAGGLLKAGQLVRVVPPFTSANQQPMKYREQLPDKTVVVKTTAPLPVNFGYLYSEPVADQAKALTDPYFSDGWQYGSNWANKVPAGGTYVVAEVKTNWTAIWYRGQKAWFYNPGGQYTSVVKDSTQRVLKPAPGKTPLIYGRAFPEASAYPGTNGVTAPTDNPNYLSKYSFGSGAAYVKAGPAVKGDDYFGSAQTNVVGTDMYIPIRYNHRMAWVKASDVVESAPAPAVNATNRYNVLARDASGVLWQYQGTGNASAPFLNRYRVGPGWQAYNAVTPMTALRADGTGDAVARDASGVLWYYQGSGNPAAPFKARLRTGGGWGVYDKIIAVRDVTNDGRPDLIAREKSGVLWLYKGTGTPATPFATRIRVGGGWQTYNAIVSTGDLSGDGKADLIGRDASGVLWSYKGTGSSTTPFATRYRVGAGWGAYNSIVGPSDLSTDGKGDLIARDASGALWSYKGTGSLTAPFATRVNVGPGWQIYNLIF
ncbi:N-acetylmuramoyl-L-alanine amidase [Streptomyces gardneri]|uniref:N-acetylmuramoyl-L-alanine amidase n=1 Tax=Streptomyces gardneri TaxID=66892 RepID=UPI0006E211D1|nr:N-acetylmuramoyl-L-alanine amidase [Streptomyces gardneri]QPK45052.1 N-acetylmuramoyl-L-alanine amidase [Streptomyces gardneri]WRK36368.1 N-acetylmuramoyl-L-alanine amidase [Streptomyces venezuelae]